MLAGWFGQPGLLRAQDPLIRERQRYLLDWSFKKLQKDGARVAELARKLSASIREDSRKGMPEEIEKRTRDLACKAEKLHAAVKAASKNQLSIEVVQLAAEIEDEGKALREEFKSLAPAWRRKKFRDLANGIRKKAGSVKSKMRMP